MEFLPKALGTRPRLAVEIRMEGVVAARAEDAAGLLVAVARANVLEGSVLPGLKVGNIADRAGLTAAVRSALDAVAVRGSGSGASIGKYVTLVVPDAAVRVLLLDFDSLPGKIVEALPVVRFRLKKLLPFEVEEAVVSYQIMSSSKGLVTVVAVAIPRDVLGEYERVVTAAGYLPGAVLPSTLAALAGLGIGSGQLEEGPASTALVVNTGTQQVTTAIVRGGVLLLHRTLEMSAPIAEEPLEAAEISRVGLERIPDPQTGLLLADLKASSAGEVSQAVSVATAYFEDTLSISPEVILSTGTSSAESLQSLLDAHGLNGLRVRELMEPAMLEAGAISASVPRGWLAGVRGALTS
jgi:type IV pilus assembly protein PilM